MNSGLALCLGLMSLLFAAIAIIFAVRKEKACSLIAGFNFFTEEQQAQYDRARIARDQMKRYAMLAAVTLAGAVLCLFIGWWAFGSSILAMLILLFRDFHIFADEAFKKYKI